MHWVFEGIGTALVVFILGLIARPAIKRRRVSQRQRARDQATQVQSGRDTNIGRDE
jgi:hypothetical protein